MESQAALRRGLAAERAQRHRVQKRQQNWQRNRSHSRPTKRSIASDNWEQVPYTRSRRSSRKPESQPLTLSNKYQILRTESQYSSGEERHRHKSRRQALSGEYNSIYDEASVESRRTGANRVASKRHQPNRGGRGPRGRLERKGEGDGGQRHHTHTHTHSHIDETRDTHTNTFDISDLDFDTDRRSHKRIFQSKRFAPYRSVKPNNQFQPTSKQKAHLSSKQSANDPNFSSKFRDVGKRADRTTANTQTHSRLRTHSRVDSRHNTRLDTTVEQDIEMQTVTNTNRCFRSGPVTAVKELEVNDSNFPALYSYQPAQCGAKRVTQKTKSGHTMNPGKVQDSKVTTLSNPNHTNSGPTWPHPVVGSFLEKLSARELHKGFRRMNKPPKKKPPPNTQSVSILMKAPKGVNSKG